MKDYHLTKLPEYNNFWCLVYFLGIVLITLSVVLFRYFFMGYSSSHLYVYTLIFLIIYCFLAIWSHISSSSNSNSNSNSGSNDMMLMFFYFVFAVVFALCLLNLPSSILGFDLMTMISTLQSNFSSFFSSLLSFDNIGNSLNILSRFHIPDSIFGFIFALLLGILPPLLVESAFRFAQLELRKHFSISGFLSSHLLCLACFFSIPGILHLFEGRVICGIL